MPLTNVIKEFMDTEYDTLFGKIKMKDLEFFKAIIELAQEYDPSGGNIQQKFLVDVVKLHRTFTDRELEKTMDQ